MQVEQAPVQAEVAPEDDVRQRLAQQALIADFGLFALKTQDMDAILQEACRVAAEGLAVRFAKVLEKLPDADAFILRAGVGWRPGLIGKARVGADLDSPAGFAFKTGEPVISNHLADEGRFRTPKLMVDHGVLRATNVLIRGEGEPFGVLETDSRDPGTFTPNDTHFLQALANVLGVALDKEKARIEIERLNASLVERDLHFRRATELSNQMPWTADTQGQVIYVDERWLDITGLTRSEAMGEGWVQVLHPEDREGVARAWAYSITTGQPYDCEFCVRTANGTYRWVRSQARPWRTEDSGIRLWYGTLEDINAQKAAELKLSQALADKDLLVREIDHRIKNSLTMVGSLLRMQEREATAPEAKTVLAEASSRLMTIARVHEQLYKSADIGTVIVSEYLEGVCRDLVQSLGRRDIQYLFEADRLTLSVDKAVPLGLITTELLTNALKYARREGRSSLVRVCLRGTEHDLLLQVTDDGPGLPAGFDLEASKGLGMRLVRLLVRQLGAQLTAETVAGGACFSVRVHG